ncbi:msrA2 [Symbiodinium natans]|uniref:peptide-methionine (S)-S-oxide reductase n=1 Tax=Symbiodinium natans TaxID=878477 RepID=A0A812HRS9_9DINO|nr:msrA2 [Symbiodinium natans]
MRLAAAMRRGRAGQIMRARGATPVVLALAAGTLLSRSFIGCQPSDRGSRVSRAFFGGLFGSPQGSPTPIKDAPQENARHYLTGNAMYPPWPAGMQEAMFGMGCFWCAAPKLLRSSENIFMRMPGVYSTQVGYAGGSIENPTYGDVCTGATNHNEVVRVVYDPQKVSYAELLQKFWEKHDPTTLNQQGNDFGTQYRSGIYYYSEEQKLLAEETRARYEQAIRKEGAAWGRSIATEIVPAPTFYYAESYHQQYDAKPGNRDYCGLRPLGVQLDISDVEKMEKKVDA